MLMHASVISNLIQQSTPSKYCKAKSEESDESDKPMKQMSLPVYPSMKSVL